MGKNYERMGRYAEALEAFRKAGEFSGGTTEPLSLAGYTYAVAGQKTEAERILRELQEMPRHRYVPPYNVALVYHGLGDSVEALDWLEKACEENDVHMVFLAVDPKWDTLRNDPRFNSLLGRKDSFVEERFMVGTTLI